VARRPIHPALLTAAPFLLLFGVVLLVMSCGPHGADSRLQFKPITWRTDLDDRVDWPFPRRVSGLGGADLQVHAPPRRIVAGSVLSAEVLLAIAPRERIAGVHYLAADSRYSMVAKSVAGVPLVGAEPEQLLAVRPDLVLVDAFTRAETHRLLQAAGVPVVRTQAFSNFGDVADNIRLIGWVTGLDAAAEQLVVDLRARVAALAKEAPAVQGWHVLTLDGALDTCGRGSLVDTVVRAAGAVNVAADHDVGPFRKLDIESVLAWRPDALLVGVVAGEEDSTRARLQQDRGLRLLPCVQRQRIVFVPAALLASTSHLVAGASEQLQAQLRAWGRP